MRFRHLLLSALCVACSSSGTEPNGNNGNNGNNNGNNGGNQNPIVRINIRGLTGLEGAMEVRYTVANTPLTRAAESTIPRPSPIQYCVTVGSTGTCDITVPIGKSISLFAYEGSDGAVKQVAPGNGFTLEKTMHEFVAFTGGDCVQPAGFLTGDCVVTPTTARTYVVGADFTILPTYRIYSTGMTTASGTVTARPVLGLPVRANIFTVAGTGGSSATEVVVTEGAFAFGTVVTLTATNRNQAQFIRWEGCKTGTGGTNPTCTLPQSTSGAAPATVRLFGEYWQCAVGIADAPGSGCTKVRP